MLFLVKCRDTYLSEHPGGSKLTVKDSKGGGTITYPVGKFSSINSLFSTSEKSTLVIESGTFILTAAEEGNHGHIVDCYGESTVDINGGVFRNETGYESRMGNSCIWVDSGKLTVDNAKLYSSSQCIYIRATDPTSVEVKNCSFEHGMDAINIDNGTLTIGNSLFTATKDNAHAINISDSNKVGYISDCLASGNNAYVDGELYTQTKGFYLGNTTAGCKVEIGSPRITHAELGVAAPTVGAVPENHCGSGSYYYSGGAVTWSPKHATFQEGVSYTAKFEAEIDYFDGVFANFLDVTLNGEKASVLSGAGTKKITATYTFPALTSTETIDSVSITDLTAPVAGATPGNASTTDTRYSVVNTMWDPEPGSTFKEKTEYSAVITLEANLGYQFTADTTSRVGGKTATLVARSAQEAKLSVTFPATAKLPTVAIRNNPGTRPVDYGDGIYFVAVYTDLPAGAQIRWFVDDVEKSTGELFSYGNIKKNATVTVKLTDAEGTVLRDADGAEISDSETIQVKAGFFKKLLSFLKNLFRVARIVAQAVTED